MNPGFWKDKKVFLTGHTGFKGSWLSLWLQRLGSRVTGYALDPPTQPNLFGLTGVARSMDSVTGDVRDLAGVENALRLAEPEIVLHMAAQALVRESYVDPVGTFATNVLGTANVLEAARGVNSVQAVVIVTSDKCYENREQRRGYREDDSMGGHDPYSASKGCAELVTAAYRRSFFSGAGTAAVASARAGNVIGGGDWSKDRLVSDAMSAFVAGRPVSIRHPNSVRPWQHVLDPLSGYLTLAERLCSNRETSPGAWNFGPEEQDARPVGWLVDELARRWGEGATWEADAGSHVHEAGILMLDCTKARKELGWRPHLPLATALDWTVEWYRCHADGGEVRRLTEEQIRRYQDGLAR